MNILEIRKMVLAVLLAFAATTMLQACSTTEEESSGSSSSAGQPEPDNPLDPECVEGSPLWPACSYD